MHLGLEEIYGALVNKKYSLDMVPTIIWRCTSMEKKEQRGWNDLDLLIITLPEK